MINMYTHLYIPPIHVYYYIVPNKHVQVQNSIPINKRVVPNKHVEGEISIPSNKHVDPNKCGASEIFSKK